VGCTIFSHPLIAKFLESSVAKGLTFRPQSLKRAEKNWAVPGKSGAELLTDLSKKGRKGAKLF
jgi:hypothetical protein